MSDLAFFPLYIGDWLRETRGMTFQEQGITLALKTAYISGNGRLPIDTNLLHRIIGVFTDEEARALERALERAFTRKGDFWVSDSLNQMIDKQKRLLEQRREAGRRSAAKKARAYTQPEPEPEPEPEQETEPEGEASSVEPLPATSSKIKTDKQYAFAGKIIRLNQSDLDLWKKNFHAIPDIVAELYNLDNWCVEENIVKWFNAVSRALGNKHQKLIAAKPAEKKGNLLAGSPEALQRDREWGIA